MLVLAGRGGTMHLEELDRLRGGLAAEDIDGNAVGADVGHDSPRKRSSPRRQKGTKVKVID
jgi:hypothetical protein